MRFVILLLAYIIQRRFNVTLSQDLESVCRKFQQKLVALLPSLATEGWLLFGICVVIPVLLFGLIVWALQGLLLGALTLFIEVIVLFIVMGYSFSRTELDAYLKAWEEGRTQAAFHYAEHIDSSLGITMMGSASDPKPAINQPAKFHQQVWNSILYQTFACYFSVIFWFALTGPIGALFARLTHQATAHGYTPVLQQAASQVDHFVQWIPARLLVITFALAGNFAGCMRRAREVLLSFKGNTQILLVDAAEGSLIGEASSKVITDTSHKSSNANIQREQEARQLKALRDLLNRSVILWLAVLAALVIVGYL